MVSLKNFMIESVIVQNKIFPFLERLLLFIIHFELKLPWKATENGSKGKVASTSRF